ncbi:hypothetical protein B0T17DRAFT_591667 [Bombardia bombarda]|uniref:Uncharacterized protein n=1 Tax=Bombardia bombarda TaxID=252184 RepID=A0AA39WUM6_9PEZI|nr:hypothetical protein B0T17DRAFT_591667 [Bombardia bombarda]
MTPKENAQEPAQYAAGDATSLRVSQSQPIANSTGRDQTVEERAADSQPAATAVSAFYKRDAAANAVHPAQPSTQSTQSQRLRLPFSSSNSQDTSSTNETDLVFTPPASEGGMSPSKGSVGNSSQESQLLQLSQIAAAQERIPDHSMDTSADGAASRKRTADGVVKHTHTHSRSKSSVSPVRLGGYGHSRNTSTVSVASTTGSRIGELSAELKARLSYAMVKVSHGWQGHTIDQVETLASQAASPTSSNSTIHLRTASSASPQLSASSQRGSNNTTPATGPQHQFPNRLDPVWRESPHPGSRGSPASPVKGAHSLAPPVSIQPSRHLNARRNSNARHTPAFLSGSHHASPNAGPQTPGQPSPYLGTAHHRTPNVDPILFSPHQNVREQDAIESLLFMSSPGNSATLKHAFPTSSTQPTATATTQRTALPTSQPRKSLPSGRPTHARSQSHTQKRVGFEKSPNAMEIDEQFGSPYSRATPRRKLNGSVGHGINETHTLPPRLMKPILSAGLVVPSRPRPPMGDEEIDRLLDREMAAIDRSDSEGEIELGVSRARRDGAHVIGV